jgi:hypothetical protein
VVQKGASDGEAEHSTHGFWRAVLVAALFYRRLMRANLLLRPQPDVGRTNRVDLDDAFRFPPEAPRRTGR